MVSLLLRSKTDSAQCLQPAHADAQVIRLGAAGVQLPRQPTAMPRGPGQRWVDRQGFRRTVALARLDALRHQGDEAYQQLARAAAQVGGTPMASITLLDDSAQWVLGSVGVPLGRASLTLSFCCHALGTADRPTVIHDTRADPRVAAHPLVMHAPNVRFYAGAPLVYGGLVLGTVCVTDLRPREMLAAQLAALQWLAVQTMRRLLQSAPTLASRAA